MLPVLLSFRLPQRYNERFVYASSWEHKKLSLRSEPEAHEIPADPYTISGFNNGSPPVIDTFSTPSTI